MSAAMQMALERFYAAIPDELVAVAMAMAFLSLLVRLRGLQRGFLVSRPRAILTMLAASGGLALFYTTLLFPGSPSTAAARGGVVRALLIIQALGFVHWNFDYLRLALRGWPGKK